MNSGFVFHNTTIGNKDKNKLSFNSCHLLIRKENDP